MLVGRLKLNVTLHHAVTESYIPFINASIRLGGHSGIWASCANCSAQLNSAAYQLQPACRIAA